MTITTGTWIQHDLKMTRSPACPEQALLLNLMLTHEVLSTNMQRTLKSHGLSLAQFNVLRIVQGAGDEGIPCQAIGERVIQRVPDVTRLVDRLVQAKWVSRQRGETDRRVVRVHIETPGKDLLDRVSPVIAQLEQDQFSHLDSAEIGQLNRLLEKVRHPTGDPP